MIRVTKLDLEEQLVIVNRYMPVHVAIDWRGENGGFQIVRVVDSNRNGGSFTPLSKLGTKRECLEYLRAMVKGIEASQLI